jgi:hypothetical protein
MNTGNLTYLGVFSSFFAASPLMARMAVMTQLSVLGIQEPPPADVPSPALPWTAKAFLNSMTKPRWTMPIGMIFGTLGGFMAYTLYNGLKAPLPSAAESATCAASALCSSVVAAVGLSLLLRSKKSASRSGDPHSEISPLAAALVATCLTGAVVSKIAETFLP